MVIILLTSFKNGNVGCGWLILCDVLFNVGYIAVFSHSVLYFGDEAFCHSGGVCPTHRGLGLLLYVDFIIQSDVSRWQDNFSSKTTPGGVPSKNGLADGSRNYKRLVF